MHGMDPAMVREFAQDMNRALATAEATISAQSDALSRVRKLANDFLSTESNALISAGSDILKALNGDS
jgi:hypothetical protein